MKITKRQLQYIIKEELAGVLRESPWRWPYPYTEAKRDETGHGDPDWFRLGQGTETGQETGQGTGQGTGHGTGQERGANLPPPRGGPPPPEGPTIMGPPPTTTTRRNTAERPPTGTTRRRSTTTAPPPPPEGELPPLGPQPPPKGELPPPPPTKEQEADQFIWVGDSGSMKKRSMTSKQVKFLQDQGYDTSQTISAAELRATGVFDVT